MRILIDYSQVPLQKTGVGVYALNLITKIYEEDKKNIYYILVQDDDDSLCFIRGGYFKLIKVKSKIFRKILFRVILEQFYIPYLMLRYKIDLLHSLHYSFPLISPGKRIVTVHDMSFFAYPETHVFIKRYYFRFFLFMASFFAEKIITVSKSTTNDFLGFFKNADKSRMHVVYHGKSELLRPDSDKGRIKEIKSKFKINKAYLLFLGTIEPRKNIRSLIIAFSKFLQGNKDYLLVIAGKKGWYYRETFKLVEELNLGKDVVFTGFINEKDKPFVIAGAKIFIYPSIYEGFGIPVLEALACGVPTITSNVSSLPEIAGNAALLVNPLDPDELYLKIKDLIDNDALYSELKEKSINQAKNFNWKNAALETISVYNSVK